MRNHPPGWASSKWPGMSRKVHVWRHVLTFHQFEKLDQVKAARLRLHSSITEATRFARCQIHNPYPVRGHVSGIWDGEAVEIAFSIRPLFFDQAERLYDMVAREVMEKFPRFTEHTIEDGPYVGERRIDFTTTEHEVALCYMVIRMLILADEGAVKIGESVAVRPDSIVLERKGRKCLEIDVVLDRPIIDGSVRNMIKEMLSQGLPLPIDPTPRSLDRIAIQSAIAEMSLPELAYLNWQHVRNPLTDADEAMFKAAKTFDPELLTAALASGANPNALDAADNTALLLLAHGDRWDYLEAAEGENWDELAEQIPAVTLDERIACMTLLLEAGAHIDLAGPDGLTPLVGAVARQDADLVEWLLLAGADDTAPCNDESLTCSWPPAWDWVAGDWAIASRGTEEEEVCKRVWNTLSRYRRPPSDSLPAGTEE